MATGLLIGSCFYRFGGLIGMVLVLINVLPMLAVEGQLSVSYFGQLTLDAFGWERQPLALVISRQPRNHRADLVPALRVHPADCDQAVSGDVVPSRKGKP